MEQLGKVFLSHKSEDKDYVRYVAEKIGVDRCHYDEYTFESGMKTLDEIIMALDSTDLFVLFISDKALNSDWVTRERGRAHTLLKQGKLRQIYPIIIDPDPNILHSDKRIPAWMRDHYNIRKILSPKLAVQKIRARMRELTWEINPLIRSEQVYFFGRNQEIEAFEQRRGNLDRPELVCCVASGFEGIGRKRYMDHCLKKANILRPSHSYNLIQMEMHESAEDFILKLSDLCAGEDTPTSVMALKSTGEKSTRVAELLTLLQKNREVVFVDDSGTLITPIGEMVGWLKDALTRISPRFVLGIASKYHLKGSKCLPSVFQVHLGELSKSDRTNMLREYSTQQGYELNREILHDISKLLTGYPAQIFWAVALLEEYGEATISKHFHEIVEYSSDKAEAILHYFDEDEKAMGFLTYLSQFELISTDMLNKAFELDDQLVEIYERFHSLSICYLYGSNGEMIRVSDVIRDYIERMQNKLPEQYKRIIDEMVKASINESLFEDTDLASYYAVMKQKLLHGEVIDSNQVLPSLYIRTIVELYNRKQYRKACILCEKLIEQQADQNFEIDLRRTLYIYLCQSLAREHNIKFNVYINDSVLSKVDKLYLRGFYCRIDSKPKNAIELLTQALTLDGNRAQIRRELVNAYILSEDYDSALQYSRENYQRDSLNHYHAQSYFRCLINQPNAQDYKEEMKSILNMIKRNRTPKAQQMSATMEAQYVAEFEHDQTSAFGILEHAMIDADDSKVYLLLTKFDIAFKYGDIIVAQDTFCDLEKEIRKYSYFQNALTIRSARLIKLKKGPITKIENELYKLSHLPESALIKLQQQLLG